MSYLSDKLAPIATDRIVIRGTIHSYGVGMFQVKLNAFVIHDGLLADIGLMYKAGREFRVESEVSMSSVESGFERVLSRWESNDGWDEVGIRVWLKKGGHTDGRSTDWRFLQALSFALNQVKQAKERSEADEASIYPPTPLSTATLYRRFYERLERFFFEQNTLHAEALEALKTAI